MRRSINLFKRKKENEPQARTLEQSASRPALGEVFVEKHPEERTPGYVGFFLKEWINVTLIIPHMAAGQLPPPAS